jgi:hypothetical protein
VGLTGGGFMKIPKLAVVIILFSLFATGCSDASASDSRSLIEISEYSEEHVQLDWNPEVYIACDNANIEVYTWDNKNAKFEIKKRARGIEERDVLAEKLKDFEISINKDGNRLYFKSVYKYKVKLPSERMIDLVLYLPKKISLFSYTVGTGSIKIYDDMNSTLKARFSRADLDINRFAGALNIEGKMGNVKIAGGRLDSDSSISLGTGSIVVRALFDSKGDYNFETGMGNIELLVPEESRISAECIGTVDINEFQPGRYPAAIKVKNSMGRITVKSF